MIFEEKILATEATVLGAALLAFVLFGFGVR